MDSLQMFWPGLQVLSGDVSGGSRVWRAYEMLERKHGFPPEAYTANYKMHWPHWPLRPEYIESTYFLYRATGNPTYLAAGERMLNRIRNVTRVRCGFAAVLDVRKGTLEDKVGVQQSLPGAAHR